MVARGYADVAVTQYHLVSYWTLLFPDRFETTGPYQTLRVVGQYIVAERSSLTLDDAIDYRFESDVAGRNHPSRSAAGDRPLT